MLIRTVHENGVVTYQSPLLAKTGVTHGFSTRIGGVSAGAYASLNLGNPADAERPDAEENLRENYRRLLQALGCPEATGNAEEGSANRRVLRAWLSQVHSDRVVVLEAEPESEYSETLAMEVADRFHGQMSGDALVSDVRGVFLTVRVADCAPVLLAGGEGQVVAAVHAGWRGVVGGVLTRALRAMGEMGVAAKAVTAAIGPAISARHFEVGDEVAAAFEKAGLGAAVVHGGAKPHVDLAGALRQQLNDAGVPGDRIEMAEVCTYANAVDFYSHRRERGATGRMAAGIMPR